MKPFVCALALVVAVLTCGWLQQASHDSRPSDVDALLAMPPVPAGVLHALSLGFTSAAADLSFLQAIQIFGERRSRPAEEEARRRLAMYRLLDYATDLDPVFAYAYIFGGLSIPLPNEDGTARNAEDAAALLHKGIRNVTDWRVPFHLIYINSAYLLDFPGAAEAAAEAARREGRPSYVPLLATRLAAQGGTLETGIELARTMLAAAQTDEERTQYIERIELLQMETLLRHVDRAAADFEALHDRRPGFLEELYTSGLLAPLPPEPNGGQWILDPETGLAKSTIIERLRISSGFLLELKRRRGIKPQDLEARTPTP